MDGKRRLPLLPSGRSSDTPEGEHQEPRPPWHWIGFGTLAILVAWLPLSAVAAALAARLVASTDGDAERLARAGVIVVAVHASALATACLAGGYVVGRWGGEGVGVREAALAGLAASLVAVGAAWASFGFSPGSLAVVGVATPLAALGGRRGVRARGEAPPRGPAAGARPPR